MLQPSRIFGRLGNQMFQGAYIYAQMKRGVIPDIYVQDPAYFDDFKKEIKELYGYMIHENSVHCVAIHVRRGKNPVNFNEPAYSENPFYVNLSETDYYKKAMALFPDTKFIVFSDDTAWCEQQEIFKGCRFFERESGNNDEIGHFNVMASCQGIIIANSSYSWWAGYLSGGKVVAPKAWYADGVERTKCPKEWVRV